VLPYELEEEQNGASLASLLRETALFLWKDWAMNMQALMKDIAQHTFTLRGDCPHCGRASAFLLTTSVHIDKSEGNLQRWIAGMQCQGCMKYIR
jgi:hypothetical protein